MTESWALSGVTSFKCFLILGSVLQTVYNMRVIVTNACTNCEYCESVLTVGTIRLCMHQGMSFASVH
jgi:hypothetical protein